MNALETLASEVPHLQHSFDPTFVFGSVTQYVLWMFIILIITFAVVLGTAKRLTLIPTNKFTNMVEYGYEFVKKDMGENAIGHGYKKHVPFLATMFFFLLISNFVGLIPGCKTPTGTISITWALA
ncbi:MAG: F0F1 ATP synthase subunit A, partial [Raoultibacter sp.]